MKLFTVLIIVVAIVGVGIFGYVSTISFWKGVVSTRAEKVGENYLKNLYSDYSILGKSCQGEDTDDDSYVSCDFRILNGAGVENVVNLQCPTLWKSFTGSTCKQSRAIYNP